MTFIKLTDVKIFVVIEHIVAVEEHGDAMCFVHINGNTQSLVSYESAEQFMDRMQRATTQ